MILKYDISVAHPHSQVAPHQRVQDTFQSQEAVAAVMGHGGLEVPQDFHGCATNNPATIEGLTAESLHQHLVSPDGCPAGPVLRASDEVLPEKESSEQRFPAHNSRTLNSFNISRTKIEYLFDLYGITRSHSLF